VYNHLVGNYSAAINLLLPVIEGMIWDISVAEHLARGGIYSSDTVLDGRDLKKRVLLARDGTPLNYDPIDGVRPPTLRELLESSRMREILDPEFVRHFCQELYSQERNPVLHGLNLDYNDPLLSTRLLLVIEYLESLIRKRNYKYPAQLDPPDYWTRHGREEEYFKAQRV